MTFRILRNQIHEAKPHSCVSISLKQAGKGINWSLTISLQDFFAITSSKTVIQLYPTFKNKMMYATELQTYNHRPPTAVQRPDRFWNGFQHHCKHWGGKNPTTCKQRGCEVLLVQIRLRLQQSSTWPVTAKPARAKQLLGCVFLSIPMQQKYLTKPRRWKNVIFCMQVWRAQYAFYSVCLIGF